MTFEEYLTSLEGKRVAVIGIGISNQPLIELLLQRGIAVTARDKKDRTALGALAGELESRGAVLRLGADYLEDLTEDVIFRTPGMRPDLPQLRQAVERGSVLTSEMEVFFQVCPCPMLAVTGSDGKTTTTTIIASLLKKAGRTVHLGGNIGNPLLAQTPQMQPEDLAVLELSSFQLMTMTSSPHVAVITNLSPNHLDVHKDYAEYIAAKENIFTHQSAQDIAVFNADNEVTAALAKKALGRVRLFSRQREVADGVFLRGTSVVARCDGKERVVMDTSDIQLPGVHNIENYLAAIAAVDGMVSDEIIRDFARTFGGVEHRIELIRTLDGVRWYNDSIASSSAVSFHLPLTATPAVRQIPTPHKCTATVLKSHITQVPAPFLQIVLCQASPQSGIHLFSVHACSTGYMSPLYCIPLPLIFQVCPASIPERF